MARTGVASTWMMAVAYSAHSISGMRNQPMPAGRILWMVTMKLMPVKMLLKPRTNTDRVTMITAPLVVVE